MLKIEVGDQIFDCRMDFSKRSKSLRLKVDINEGIQLTMPYNVPISFGKEFIERKKDWITKQINKQLTRRNKYLYLGKELVIIQNFCTIKRFHKIELNDNTLQITSPEYSKASLSSIYNGWLRLRARTYIAERTGIIAEQNGFKFNKITIRGQKTRWGSCSRKGNLSFNYKLMQFPQNIIDYVVVHELCHLKEMNHSEKFWGLVQEIIPNYKELRYNLKNV